MDHSETSPKLTRLMSLYYESETAERDFKPEFSPIYSELEPTTTHFQTDVLLARGGMKSIFRVFNPKTARYVAMARLNPGSPEELYEPFLREARLTAQLDHPNIIKVYDIGLNADSTPYFIMELKTGESLDVIINRNHSSPNKHLSKDVLASLLNIFLKICDAIDYAHSQNVLHLDLKPQNIQVGAHGEVVVCDWGLGKLIGNQDYDGGDFDRLLLNPDLLNNMTLSGRIKGTPGFMAPEQAEGKEDKSFQTDIYSLGAILYSMLTNALPVTGETPEKVLEQTCQGLIIPPATRCPDAQIPPALSAITLKALALNPKHRYASVSEMRQDLLNYQNGFSATAENAGFFREMRLFYLRQKKILNLSGIFILLLILAAGIAFALIHNSREEAIKALAELQIEKEERQRLGRDAAPQYHERALNALSRGNIEGAFNHIKTAAVLDSTNVEYHNLLAALYFMKGQYRKADQTFWEYPQSLYRMIRDVNQAFMKNNLTREEEYIQVEKMLKNCSQIKSTPLTMALFMHWALDEREDFRKLAQTYIPFKKELCAEILAYLEQQNNSGAASELLLRVLQTLQASPDWIGRRIPAARGAKLSENKEMKKQFEELIPDNLVLGQPLTSMGGVRSNPEFAVDGIITESNYWSAAPLPAQIDIDLGDIHTISKIKVFTNDFAKEARTFRYDILLSTQQGSYTGVASRTHRDDLASTVHEYEIEPFSARFIRLKINYHSGPIPLHIHEFEVY
ncbi:protein kinase domain-containing protein [Pontiella agarivorans]|uniref:Protein kinase n=1 Tax=Pontiella agarivorans TaxID=3038953 RepID=A0ABU5N0M4_9BACT|nr:protein kinase [Pontiella agarivorans]MDZ8119995.1 protein kinase [Pontiella agarivorans]